MDGGLDIEGAPEHLLRHILRHAGLLHLEGELPRT